jgi:transcriptional regulator with XRE-family HTH domain
MKNIKKIVKARLEEIEQTANWLADQLGISTTALQSMYRSNSTSLETLEKLANVLAIAPQEFFDTPRLVNEGLAKYGLNREEADAILLQAVKIVTAENERLKNNQNVPHTA